MQGTKCYEQVQYYLHFGRSRLLILLFTTAERLIIIALIEFIPHLNASKMNCKYRTLCTFNVRYAHRAYKELKSDSQIATRALTFPKKLQKLPANCIR